MKKLGWSKWSKHRILSGSAEIRGHLPVTRLLSAASFRDMCRKYRTVILKPTSASGGSGVIQARWLGGDTYEVRAGRTVRRIQGAAAVQAFIRRTCTRPYLIQRRIALASVDGRPVDFRVMVQRLPKLPWEITGVVAKVAGKGYVITNVARSGGYVLPASTALRRAGFKGRSDAIVGRMKHVALRAAGGLTRGYPYLRTIGLDVGVDRGGRVWIIEANFTPVLSLFRKLPDPSMYRRILRMKAKAGR